jgi:cytochrome c-type biogenesis protein CcmH
MKRAFLMLFLLCSTTVLAIDVSESFEDPTLQARYRALIEQTRCLVCQNQTIADSNAGLAQDLRREIREMLAQGATDQQVIDFLVGRYGDFVLYRPPFKKTTWLLWASPVLFLAIGLTIFAVTLVRRSKQSLELDGD